MRGTAGSAGAWAAFVIAASILGATEGRADPAPVASPAAEQSTPAAAPFSFADFSWVPGNYGPSESPMATKYFTPELRLDMAYHHDFNNPADDTIAGSSEAFRHDEFQLTQIGVGGDFNYQNVGFRLMTQFGMYSTTTPRNDASPLRGQWDLSDAYRYISEAYGTYHINVMNGINVQAGIFMSYVGLWSYYNFDNWTYQPSYVSSNTPWFFNGMRVQMFPSEYLKIEPWLVNGWQSYGRINNQPGLGLQVLWRPTGWLAVLGNQYYGSDDFGAPDRKRAHTDDSVMVKYHEAPEATISKSAASLTIDAGCEWGDGVTCGTQYFAGFMAYNRLWFFHDHLGLTVGGGAITNPGMYLVLIPPINGETAESATVNSPYFNTSGTQFMAWDAQITADWMPTRNITFRLEFTHRAASQPYFAGPGGETPPTSLAAGNTGPANPVTGWSGPDRTTTENRLTGAFLVRL